MGALQDKLKKINPKYLPVLVFLIPLTIVPAFVYKVYMPLSAEKETLTGEVNTLQLKLDENKVKARKLDEVKKAKEALDSDLAKAKERLPSEQEQEKLFKEMKSMIEDAGLQIVGKPVEGKPEVAAGGLYKKFSIKYKTGGSFHEMGVFMQDLDSTSRLLRVNKLEMAKAALKGKEMSIPVDFEVIAYSAGEGK